MDQVTKPTRRPTGFWSWVIFGIGVAYFAIPLIGMFEFSLRKRRDAYSFDAYASVLGDPQFQQTFMFSLVMSFFMAFIMTAFITFLNVGLSADFVARWLRAFVIAWPVVFPLVLVLAPRIRMLVARWVEVPR